LNGAQRTLRLSFVIFGLLLLTAPAIADRFVDLAPTDTEPSSLSRTVQVADGVKAPHQGFIGSAISEIAHQCTKASVIENIEVGRAFLGHCRTPQPDPVSGDPNHCEACCLNAAVSYLQAVDQLAMMNCAAGAQVGEVMGNRSDSAMSGLTESQRQARRRVLRADVQQAQARADLLGSELRAVGVTWRAGAGIGSTQIVFNTPFGFASSVTATRNYTLDSVKCETRRVSGQIYQGAGQVEWCGDRPCAGADNQANIAARAREALSFSLRAADGSGIRYGNTPETERVPSPFPVDALDRQRLNGGLISSELADASSVVRVQCDTSRLVAAQRLGVSSVSSRMVASVSGEATGGGRSSESAAPLVVQPVDVVRRQVAEARATFRFQPENFRKSFGDDYIGISSANVFRIIQNRYQDEDKRGNFINGQEAKK
jgi:hypothetical protein